MSWLDDVPEDLDIQWTGSNDYMDPILIDTELGLPWSMIVPVPAAEVRNQQISEDGRTVGNVSDEITTTITDSFADVTETELETILGDGMVETLTKYIVTIDKCEAISDPACNSGQCQKIIHIPDLFVLQGDPPFQLTAFGIPSELSDNIDAVFTS